MTLLVLSFPMLASIIVAVSAVYTDLRSRLVATVERF